MYFDTVDWATSKPSINSSPWIRDAPHLGFSLLIRRACEPIAFEEQEVWGGYANRPRRTFANRKGKAGDVCIQHDLV
jgi:hypothetical protein